MCNDAGNWRLRYISTRADSRNTNQVTEYIANAEAKCSKHSMLLDTKLATQIQVLNPNTSGNALQAFFLTSACPCSHPFTQFSQNPW